MEGGGDQTYVTAGINTVSPAATPAPLLRAIMYCEFDPQLGPRPIFQSPPGYVSNDVSDALSDHLISSSDLCGRLVSVCAFGLRFLGHPEHIYDERYERNQHMFNACFVFEASADTTAFSPLVARLASQLRALETQHQFLTHPETRPLLQQLLTAVLRDVTVFGELRIPPSGCDFLPTGSSMCVSSHALEDVLPPALPDTVQQHEVPVLVTSVGPSLGLSLNQTVPLFQALQPYLDGSFSIKSIADRSKLDLEEVISSVRGLMGRGVVRTIDLILTLNVYVATSRVFELIRDEVGPESEARRKLRSQFLTFCRPMGGGPPPSIRRVLDLMLAMQPGKTLLQVCCDSGLCAEGPGKCIPGQCKATELPTKVVDVRKMVTFARVKRFLRLVEHYPVYTGSKPHLASIAPSTSRILQLCDGQNAYDSIACQLDVTFQQVKEVCESSPDVIVINRMSPAGSTVDNP